MINIRVGLHPEHISQSVAVSLHKFVNHSLLGIEAGEFLQLGPLLKVFHHRVKSRDLPLRHHSNPRQDFVVKKGCH